MIAKTFKTPYYAVIFSLVRTEGDEKSLVFSFNDDAAQPAGNDSNDDKENVGHVVSYWFLSRYEKICGLSY